MTMAPGLRKLVLTAHIVSSVGWLGAVAGFLALSVAGLTSQDPRLVRGVYLAMDLIVRQVIVPLALASLLIGIVQALGTTWGLFRHYWVLVKLLVITAAIVVLLLQLEPITRGPRRRGPDRALRADGTVRLQATRHDPLRSAQAGPGPPASDSCPLTERAPGDPVSRLKGEPAPRRPAELPHLGEQLLTRLLATPARLGADPAVLVHLGMRRALVSAAPADGDARLEQRPGDVGVVLGLPAHHPDRRRADIGTVKVEPDALDQVLDLLFAQTVVGAGGARLGTVAQRLDRCGKDARVEVEAARVGIQHLLGVAHRSSR
jgi:hypothetical protein